MLYGRHLLPTIPARDLARARAYSVIERDRR